MGGAATDLARWDHSACRPVRRRSGCQSCADACPVAAIDPGDAVPLASDTCIGCGRCAVACPVGAIAVKGFGDASDSHPRDDRIAVECQRVPPDHGVAAAIRVPCLGGLTVSHLLTLRLAAGDAPVILVEHGWCADCPAGCGQAMPTRAALGGIARILAELGLPDAFTPRLQRLPLRAALRQDGTARGGLSRRSLFRRLSGRTAPPLPGPAAPEDATPVLRDHLRRQALARRIAERHGGPSPDRLLPAITVSGTCDNAGACAALCPTQALKTWEGEASEGLSFDARHCLQCGLCVEACPNKALSFDLSPDRPRMAERIILTTHAIGRCRQCASLTTRIDADGHCPRCRNGIGMLRTLFPFQASEPKERECHEHT